MNKTLLVLALLSSLFVIGCSQEATEEAAPTLHPEVIDTVERELTPPPVEEVEVDTTVEEPETTGEPLAPHIEEAVDAAIEAGKEEVRKLTTE